MANRMYTKRSRESGVGSHTANHRTGGRGSFRTPAGGALDHMPTTIVEYTDKKQPTNLYPERIVSPIPVKSIVPTTSERAAGSARSAKSTGA